MSLTRTLWTGCICGLVLTGLLTGCKSNSSGADDAAAGQAPNSLAEGKDRVAQAEDGKLVLRAINAEIKGSAEVEEYQWEPSIGFWTEMDTTVHFYAQLITPGRYDVSIVYALHSASAGSVAKFEFMPSSGPAAGFEATLKATYGWEEFDEVSIGTVELSQAGSMDLTITPVEIPGAAVMNLRRVVLTPVE